MSTAAEKAKIQREIIRAWFHAYLAQASEAQAKELAYWATCKLTQTMTLRQMREWLAKLEAREEETPE